MVGIPERGQIEMAARNHGAGDASIDGTATVQISVRLTPELVRRLDEVCEQRMIGRNLLISKAVENMLDRLAPVDEAFTAPQHDDETEPVTGEA